MSQFPRLCLLQCVIGLELEAIRQDELSVMREIEGMFSGRDKVLSFIAEIIQASQLLLRKFLQSSTLMFTPDHHSDLIP